jgi:hypothetical protein
MIRIGNLKNGFNPNAHQFKVDRTTPLGNPFYMADESHRDEVCERYESWFQHLLQEHKEGKRYQAFCQLRHLLEEARKGDIVLMCWCAPKRCHAETIKAWLETQLKGTSNES